MKSDGDAPRTERSTVRRLAKRAAYDRETISAILDDGLVAHVAFVDDAHPFVIPMVYARVRDEIVLHGAAAARVLKVGASARVCACVTLLDGIVYARSQFHHSVNYRSVVVFGAARDVTDPSEKRAMLAAIVDRTASGRAGRVRAPSDKELAATRVLALSIEEASAKVRAGGPVDDEEDLALPVWAGHVPIEMACGAPVPSDEAARAFDPPVYRSKSTITGA